MLDLESARLTCNCPTWIYNLCGDRSCPHTYKAEKEIDRENMADELEKLEKEIEDDILSGEEF